MSNGAPGDATGGRQKYAGGGGGDAMQERRRNKGETKGGEARKRDGDAGWGGGNAGKAG